MMKKLLPMLFFLSMFFNGHAQRYSSLVENRQITQFFGELRQSKSWENEKLFYKIGRLHPEEIYGIADTFPDYLRKENEGLLKSDTITKYFDPKDILYLEEQYRSVLDSNWHATDFTNYQLIDSAEKSNIYKISKKRRKRRQVQQNYCYHFSFPLFSGDAKKVFFSKGYYCGFLCTTSCYYIYEKVDGNWVELTKWECWSS